MDTETVLSLYNAVLLSPKKEVSLNVYCNVDEPEDSRGSKCAWEASHESWSRRDPQGQRSGGQWLGVARAGVGCGMFWQWKGGSCSTVKMCLRPLSGTRDTDQVTETCHCVFCHNCFKKIKSKSNKDIFR